jgi:hypothetical protein
VTKHETQLDRASRPMRDAVVTWMRDRGLGLYSGWYETERIWKFKAYRAALTVEVSEDGSEARIYKLGLWCRRAYTVKGLIGGLSMAFSRMNACIICSTSCRSAIIAEELGRVGSNIPLCSKCFDDTGKLMQAMTFAHGCWKNEW